MASRPTSPRCSAGCGTDDPLSAREAGRVERPQIVGGRLAQGEPFGNLAHQWAKENSVPEETSGHDETFDRAPADHGEAIRSRRPQARPCFRDGRLLCGRRDRGRDACPRSNTLHRAPFFSSSQGAERPTMPAPATITSEDRGGTAPYSTRPAVLRVARTL